MKYILFVFVSFLSLSLYSQECLYDENKTDEFTKKRVVRLKRQRIFSKMATSTEYVDASLVNSGGFKFLFVVVKTTYSSSCFDDSDKLYFKLKNDSIFTISNTETECGTYGSNVYTYFLSFDLSEEDVETLKSSPIVKLRLKSIEGEIKEKNQNYFVDNLKCLE